MSTSNWLLAAYHLQRSRYPKDLSCGRTQFEQCHRSKAKRYPCSVSEVSSKTAALLGRLASAQECRSETILKQHSRSKRNWKQVGRSSSFSCLYSWQLGQSVCRSSWSWHVGANLEFCRRWAFRRLKFCSILRYDCMLCLLQA